MERAGRGLLLTLSFLILASSAVRADAEGRTVKVGVFPAAPLVFMKEGKADGLFIELFRYISKDSGWRIEYVEAPWSEQLEMLKRGEIDLLPAIGFSRQRSEIYDFNAHPVFIDSGVLFTSSRFAPRTVFDLDGRRVAAVKGSAFTTGFLDYVSSFGVECDIVETEDNPSVMLAIQEGEVDAGVCIYSLGSELAKSYRVSITPINFSPIALEYAVPAGQDGDILSLIDRRMAEMADVPDSPYRKIYDKWTRADDVKRIPRWVWWGLIAFLAAGAFLAAWVSILRRQVAQKTRHLNEELERKRASAAALSEEKERLSVILSSIADGVITTDNEATVTGLNAVAERLCGWSSSEAVGKPIAEVLVLENVAPGGDASLVPREGPPLQVSISSSPLDVADNQRIGTVFAFRDVTGQRKMLDEMQRTDKLEALGALAGGIAHDFNNLLAGVFGFIELARTESSPPAVAARLDRAMYVFDRAKSLAQQLLTFASGGAPVKSVGALGPLVRETAAFATAGSNCVCSVEVAEDLRACEFDGNQIGQVIDNLVINARQAMPAGGAIKIRAENVEIRDGEKPGMPSGPAVMIEVADEGTGIPYHIQKRIFDPFFTTKESGHGLGLATCNSIVQRHSGCIEMESEPGTGATFRIFLPATDRPVAPRDPEREASPVAAKGRILILDDEDFMRELVTMMLASMGYGSVAVEEAARALEVCRDAAARGEAFAAALLDLTIPGGKGGKDIATELSEAYPGMALFAMSGYSGDPIMADPAKYGFAGSLAKPFRSAELRSLLAKRGY